MNSMPYPPIANPGAVGLSALGVEDQKILQTQQALNRLVQQFNAAVQQMGVMRQKINELTNRLNYLHTGGATEFDGVSPSHDHDHYLSNGNLLNWPQASLNIGHTDSGTNWPNITITPGFGDIDSGNAGSVVFQPAAGSVIIWGGSTYQYQSLAMPGALYLGTNVDDYNTAPAFSGLLQCAGSIDIVDNAGRWLGGFNFDGSIGNNASQVPYSTAIGNFAIAGNGSASGCTAIGSYADASGETSTAIGYLAKATAAFATAIGPTTASVSGGFSVGGYDSSPVTLLEINPGTVFHYNFPQLPANTTEPGGLNAADLWVDTTNSANIVRTQGSIGTVWAGTLPAYTLWGNDTNATAGPTELTQFQIAGPITIGGSIAGALHINDVLDATLASSVPTLTMASGGVVNASNITVVNLKPYTGFSYFQFLAGSGLVELKVDTSSHTVSVGSATYPTSSTLNVYNEIYALGGFVHATEISSTGGVLQADYGVNTPAIFPNGADGTTAIQVKSWSGNVLMSFDTTNQRIGIHGNTSPAYALDVTGQVQSSVAFRSPALRPVSDGTAALEVQNNAGAAIMTFDTTNGVAGINVSPNSSFDLNIYEWLRVGTGIATTRISPITDGTTALEIMPFGGGAAVMTFDTTNRICIPYRLILPTY